VRCGKFNEARVRFHPGIETLQYRLWKCNAPGGRVGFGTTETLALHGPKEPVPMRQREFLFSWSFLTCFIVLFVVGIMATGVLRADEIASVTPIEKLTNPDSKDQDDMCIWVHPEKRELSTVIASDKSAGQVFVYDLTGQRLQAISVPKPGNIDIRQRVMLDGSAADFVVVNQRTDGFKLVVFRVNSQSRQLERVDGQQETLPNYGGSLFHSPKTGKLYFFCTSENGTVEQLELEANGRGGVDAKQVRKLTIGKCEGAVADDDEGFVYISEEKKGIWKFAAEPDAPATGSLIAGVGHDGLMGDVEGLALRRGVDGTGMLIVSDQGRNRFAAYDRRAPHQYLGKFSIEGASQTDGIDVYSGNLGPTYPDGLFACHTDQSPRWVLLTSWNQIERHLPKGSTGNPSTR
jgi:3-phytase